MKIIDLLNKIANGEEVPKKIRINDIDDRITRHYNFFYDEDDREYKDDELFPIGARLILDRVLNKRVEIIEEEKKIPEKLKMLNANDHSKEVYYENYSKEEISLDIETLQNWVNKIIDYLDYLKSKGE